MPGNNIRRVIMKIKVIEKSYDEVMALKKQKHKKPIKPSLFFRTLLKLVSVPDLTATHFHHSKIGMEKLGRDEPALFLMNHSSFIDLEIVASVLYPRPFNIVTTGDGFIGKDKLMRWIGCIPTNKFVTDTTLVRDIIYTVRKLKSSVVLFPEAGYSFDGTSTTLPDSTGALIKMLGIPVVMIHAYGAFARDPLYNNLQRRNVTVSATESYILSPEDINNMSADEINEIVNREFSFDNFAWQQQNHIKINENFRADFLNRVLYKCPHCEKEGVMQGDGTKIKCNACGIEYTLDEYGYLSCENGETRFNHVPNWYKWERECVKNDIKNGKYGIDIPVDICMTVDTKHLYHIGEGRLVHNGDGFVLDGCDGKLHYEQKSKQSYTVNSDFNWYELGDVVSVGNNEHLFYCFPKAKEDIVTKIRLAAEEIYKIKCEENPRKAVNRV